MQYMKPQGAQMLLTQLVLVQFRASTCSGWRGTTSSCVCRCAASATSGATTSCGAIRRPLMRGTATLTTR